MCFPPGRRLKFVDVLGTLVVLFLLSGNDIRKHQCLVNRYFGSVVFPKRLKENLSSTSIPSRKRRADVPEWTRNRLMHHLHDKTANWSASVRRLWLDDDGDDEREKPPAQLLLTSYGWNNPDQVTGRTYSRTIRTRDLLRGVINHPWFHPTVWEDWRDGKEPPGLTTNNASVDALPRYYVFLDVDTCVEGNWPTYGKKYGHLYNADRAHGRDALNHTCFGFAQRNGACEHIRQALAGPPFNTPGVSAKLVLWECDGFGPGRNWRRRVFGRKNNKGKNVAVVAVSSLDHDTEPDLGDQGLVPPAVTPAALTERDLHNVRTCNETDRPHFFTFAGNFRAPIRQAMREELHNGEDVLILTADELRKSYYRGSETPFTDFLKASQFAAVPRGDNLFSYRFTEVLSSGAIPVVYADHWDMPFHKRLIDWKECAVIIAQSDVGTTLDVLAAISPEGRCRMRRQCVEWYRRYAATSEGVVAGVIEGLERLAVHQQQQDALQYG